MNTKTNLKGPVDNTIFFIIISIILFVESLLILIGIIRRGVMKKDILLKKTDLGFDITIYHE